MADSYFGPPNGKVFSAYNLGYNANMYKYKLHHSTMI